MVDAVRTMNDVLQKSKELYDLERQFRDKPLTDWFSRYIQAIDMKLQTKKRTLLSPILRSLQKAINNIQTRVRCIGYSIALAIPSVESFGKDQLVDAFGTSSEPYVEAVYDRFRRMVKAMESFKGNVAKCEATFLNQTYKGKRDEIVTQMNKLFDLKPTTLTHTEIQEFDVKVLGTLQNLPETNGRKRAIFELIYSNDDSIVNFLIHKAYEEYI